MEAWDNPLQAAARELKEEIGAVGELIELGGFLPTPGYCEELIHLFLGKVESFGDTLQYTTDVRPMAFAE